MKNLMPRLVATALLACALPASALQVSSLSPQGEIARVRQVTIKFDESAVPFGDARAPAPASLSCSDAQATRGKGRWNSDREWVFEFDSDLPPGVSCTVQTQSGFTSPKGSALAAARFRFNTGGPFVQSIYPGGSARVDEEQYFILRLNGAATAASVQSHVWCAVEGLGERVPVRLIDGSERTAVLKSQGLDKAAAKEPLRHVTLACQRRFTPDTQVSIVFGKGVATPSGVANTTEKRFTYRVREAFAVDFSCERENAQAACLPIRPMRLSFNAPVPRKLAEGIRLTSGRQTHKPVFDQEQADGDSLVSNLSFEPPFAEQTPFTVELPRDFRDAAGRKPDNGGDFPLKVATGAMPPLAKFAAAPFGIVERLAEPGSPPLLPVTLRNVEAALNVQGLNPAGQVSQLQPRTDTAIIAWFRKVQRFDDPYVSRKAAQAQTQGPLPRVLEDQDKRWVESRAVSLLKGQPGLKTLELPQPVKGDPRPFEVVGIPLTPGFHVLEIASAALGGSLLDDRYGGTRTMYVRTSALVTNLGVHFKLGRENALAWVTTLDKGKPVAGALVRVSDCSGKEVATGTTNAQGVADLKGVPPEAPHCGASDGDEGGDSGRRAYFVSARANDGAVEDLAFTWSNWYRGIEPWRFNVPTSREARPDERAHTVFDRTLLRAGETVSMKHLIRTETGTGFGLPAQLPDTLVVTHTGSGQEFTQPLAWRKTATGGQSAENTFAVPPGAKLGVYQVTLRKSGVWARAYDTGSFRVEEFRLPVLEGRISPQEKKALVKVQTVPADLQVNYVSGGGAANLPVRVSALVRGKFLSYADFDTFSFQPPRADHGDREARGDEEEQDSGTQEQRVIADKLPVTLDRTV